MSHLKEIPHGLSHLFWFPLISITMTVSLTQFQNKDYKIVPGYLSPAEGKCDVSHLYYIAFFCLPSTFIAKETRCQSDKVLSVETTIKQRHIFVCKLLIYWLHLGHSCINQLTQSQVKRQLFTTSILSVTLPFAILLMTKTPNENQKL